MTQNDTSPFIFATGKRKTEDLPKKQKNSGLFGDIAHTLSKMKQKRQMQQRKEAEEKLRQARRDYEIAAATTGIKEETIKAKLAALDARERELQAIKREHEIKQQEEALKKKKEEDFWAIKKRVEAMKSETV